MPTLSATVKSANSLHAFLEGDGLTNALIALADVDLETAVPVAAEARGGREIPAGAESCRSSKTLKHFTKLDRVLGAPTSRLISISNLLLFKQDMYLLALLAICYRYLDNAVREEEALERMIMA